MAAAALTVTAARETVVNFIRPFMHVGLTVVVQKPPVTVNIPYSFGIFQPLDPAVWGLILLALTVVSNYHFIIVFVYCIEVAARNSHRNRL